MQTEQGMQPSSLWYKDAVIYELHVRAFCDSTGDGVGDFKGLISKLDYLKGLGVTAVWLLPFYKSPLRDDGYDVSDHMSVSPELGDLKDFQKFVREAHKRGLKVITELILNHTSIDHPWFQRARRSPPGSPLRDYYTWSDTPDKYREARVIFSDTEPSNWTWDTTAKAYYWHRFYSHQPDLNYDNPLVQEETFRIADFWLRLGVDGLRLDGVPYLFEREGTNCESLPETHAFLKKLRKHVDGKFPDRMLLAEANQWPSDAAKYFGDGDECHMAFHFPLMPRMFMALQLEDRVPVVDIIENTPPIPDPCQWALFLRNHDELTLEMVTDEERDYLFRTYARHSGAKLNLGIKSRLAPLLSNDRKTIELMKLLQFTLPGTPVIYYGDEILMGDNDNLSDRNSVRTPMQWDSTLNGGFSRSNPQRLYLPLVTDPEFSYETVNVETQERNPSSHLWWMRRLVAARGKMKVLGRGTLDFVDTRNQKVLAFTRSFEGTTVLVAVNLSNSTQVGELGLSSFEGRTPVDIFGTARFPTISWSRYFLTFGPHGFYVFDVTPAEGEKVGATAALPEVSIRKGLEDVARGEALRVLETKAIPTYLASHAWFKGRGKGIDVVKVRDLIPLSGGAPSRFGIMLADVYYQEGMPETYLFPLAYAGAEQAGRLTPALPHSEMAAASVGEERGVVYDGTTDEEFNSGLMGMRGKAVKGARGELRFGFKKEAMQEETAAVHKSRVIRDNRGDMIVYNETMLLRLIRNPAEGTNPEVELGGLLAAKGFRHAKRILGDLTYSERGAGPLTVGILYDFDPTAADMWSIAVGGAQRALGEQAQKRRDAPRDLLNIPLIPLAHADLPAGTEEAVGADMLARMRTLGEVTAEFHNALCGEANGFVPQPFGYLYQVSVAYALTTKAHKVLRRAKGSQGFSGLVRLSLNDLADSEDRILDKANRFRTARIDSVRARIHGDFQLKHVLEGGSGMVVSAYEGDESEPMDARRIMRSPLKDVARMVRSIHQAAHAGMAEAAKASGKDPELLEDWAYAWYKACASVFLGSYLDAANGSKLAPQERETLQILLEVLLLDECLAELEACLGEPESVMVPIRALMELLET